MRLFPSLVLACFAATAAGQTLPSVHPDEIIAKYGKPDKRDTTAYDNPRPPLVTASLTYRKERVRFVFLADGPVGSPPPYKRWRLLGAQDSVDNHVLKSDELNARMSARRSRK